MARSKKRQKASEKTYAKGVKAEKKSLDSESRGDEAINSAPETGQNAMQSETSRTANKNVGLSACAAGMLATFALGLYLGTLLPDMLGGRIANNTQAAREIAASGGDSPTGLQEERISASPNAPLAGDAASARKQPAHGQDFQSTGIPDELARMIGGLEAKVAANPNDADIWAELGNLYFDTSQIKKAISAYERSLALSPGNADILTDLGIMYRENGQPDKALESFGKAIALNPRHENAIFNQGVILYTDMGKKDDAARAWKRLLSINPEARAPDGRTVADMIKNLR